MKKERASWSVLLLLSFCFLLMLSVNILAEVLPLFGRTTGEISAQFFNAFTPPGYVFAIWGLIYLLLALHSLYQLGLLRAPSAQLAKEDLSTLGILFAVSSLLNVAWLFAFHGQKFGLSFLILVGLLMTLVAVMEGLNSVALSAREQWLVKLPFAIYFAWVLVATVAGGLLWAESLGLSQLGAGDHPAFWSLLLLLSILALFLAWRYRSVGMALVFIWAYVGILVRHLSELLRAYPVAIGIVSGGILLFLGLLFYLFLPQKSRRQ